MAGDTDLALRRTFLAHERTLMAWIRTSTSLISFGFTIYKFFEYLIEADKRAPLKGLFGPREFAMTMIGVGVITLAVATIHNRSSLKGLEHEYGETYRSLAGRIATFVSILGFGLLIVVLFRQ
jgi:putative membrane protein